MSGNYDFTVGVCAKDYMQYDSIITEIDVLRLGKEVSKAVSDRLRKMAK